MESSSKSEAAFRHPTTEQYHILPQLDILIEEMEHWDDEDVFPPELLKFWTERLRALADLSYTACTSNDN